MTSSTPGRTGRLDAGFRRVFGGLPRQFWFQWLGVLVNRLGMFVQPFLVLYLTVARGFSVVTAGLLVGVWGAGSIIGPLLGGWLADRAGRRVTMAFAMIVSAVSLAGLGAARSVTTIAVAAFVAGAAAEMYRPASSAMVVDIVPERERPRAFGLLFWAVNLGFSVSAAAGGFLADVGFGWLFAVDAATCLMFAALIWWGTPREPPRRTRADTTPVGFGTALRDGLLVALLVLTMLYASVYQQAYVTLPLAVRDSGLPPSAYGLVITFNGLVIVVLQPFAGAVITRLRPIAVMAASAAVLCAGMALTGVVRGIPGFAAVVVVWTLGEIGMSGTSAAFVARLAPDGAGGRYQGLHGLAWAVAALVGPVVGSGLYAGVGPASLWWACAGTGVVLAVGFVLIDRAAVDRVHTGTE